MAEVRVEELVKAFGSVRAVDGVSETFEDGKLTVMVGPSGCGKTTLLRLIAGLEESTEGAIYIAGERVEGVPAWRRNIAMVFQNYALYPHMSVFKNLAYPLKSQRLEDDEIERRVHEAAALLGIEPLLERRPQALSGGQQQRVAVGRAIVREPAAFLMDEPLSNLDAKLRVETRAELKHLQKRLGITTLYVTHDQAEAMTMADKLIVMQAGRIQQAGTPEEVYERPQNIFVAGFIGSPAMNFLPVTYDAGEGALVADAFRYPAPEELRARLDGAGEALILGVRPEDVEVLTEREESALPAQVYVSEPLGRENLLTLELEDESHFKALAPPEIKPAIGDRLWLRFHPQRLHLFDAESEEALR
jgi:multiple sugar transport system ATP-binding protein